MMKKIILLSITFVFFISCSRSIYYAYEQEDTYCTIEEHKNGAVTYRASSNNYLDYLYLDSAFGNSEMFTGIGGSYFLEIIKEKNVKIKISCFSTDLTLNPKNNVISYKKEKDSITLFKININDKCLKENKIEWFPPYMKKVKKINYNKFNLPYNKKYLKTMKK